jgi:hypothetical protein
LISSFFSGLGGIRTLISKLLVITEYTVYKISFLSINLNQSRWVEGGGLNHDYVI